MRYIEDGPPPPPSRATRAARYKLILIGPWTVGCGMASAGSLIIGTIVQANDRNDPRQLTINEDAWHTAVCPLFLPLALLAQSACTDNKATDQVARLAFRFLQRHHRGNQSLFTNAYAEACCRGKLSRVTKAFLRFLI